MVFISLNTFTKFNCRFRVFKSVLNPYKSSYQQDDKRMRFSYQTGVVTQVWMAKLGNFEHQLFYLIIYKIQILFALNACTFLFFKARLKNYNPYISKAHY